MPRQVLHPPLNSHSPPDKPLANKMSSDSNPTRTAAAPASPTYHTRTQVPYIRARYADLLEGFSIMGPEAGYMSPRLRRSLEVLAMTWNDSKNENRNKFKSKL